jgi:hypothetical protein
MKAGKRFYLICRVNHRPAMMSGLSGGGEMRVYSLERAAGVLTVSPRSLADKRYRIRLGLQARKVGRKLVFVEEDIRQLLERGREAPPEYGGDGACPARRPPHAPEHAGDGEGATDFPTEQT